MFSINAIQDHVKKKQEKNLNDKLQKYINDYVDIRLDNPLHHISPQLKSFIRSLSPPSNFQNALSSVVYILCSDCSTMVGRDAFVLQWSDGMDLGIGAHFATDLIF